MGSTFLKTEEFILFWEKNKCMRGTSYALCYGRVRSCAIHKRPFKNDVTRVGWEGYPKLVTKVGTVRGVLLPSTDVNADITTKKKKCTSFHLPLGFGQYGSR